MAKQSKNSLKATLINELSKQYKQKYEGTIIELQERLKQQILINKELSLNCHRLGNEIDELREKVNKYEDWIRRLQEWCNLPEDERTKAIAEYNKKFDEFEFTKEADEYLRKAFGPYFQIMNMM